MVKELKDRHKRFCERYILDFNGTKSYQEVYPNASESTARVNASLLLTNTNIQAYIKQLQNELQEQAGISRLMVLQEQVKLAFNSIADFHNSWLSRKEFEDLTEEQKSCISDIEVKSVVTKAGRISKCVKIKLYDRQKALDAICRMLGYNAADKVDHT